MLCRCSQPGQKASPAPSSPTPFPAAGPTCRASPPGPAPSSRPSAPTPTWSRPPPGCTISATSPELAATGLHGLDGARYLRDVRHAEPLLCRLVAHHSCAVIEAEERGLAHVLTREFDPPPRPLADALTFCDMTTSPDGEQVRVHRRLAEIHDRYGTSHLVSRSIRRATPLMMEAVGHVHARTVRA